MFTPATRIAIVGGDRLLREGIASILTERGASGHPLDHASDLIGWLSAGPRDGPGVADDHPGDRPGIAVLLDWDPAAAFLEALRAARKACPRLQILVLTGEVVREEVLQALGQCVDGYMLRDDSSVEVLVHALMLVLAGGSAFSSRVVSEMIASLPASGAEAGDQGRPALSAHQRELLDRLARGCSNKVIANDLQTTEGAVKFQIRHLLRKIGVVNRTQAAIWALNRGLGRPAAPAPRPDRIPAAAPRPGPEPLAGAANR